MLFRSKKLFGKRYGIPIETILYGKPTSKTFTYTERVIRKKYGNIYNISGFYMIGDSPEGDIRGANENNWKSALVRTGLFQGIDNDPENPATFIEDDVLKSVTCFPSVREPLLRYAAVAD